MELIDFVKTALQQTQKNQMESKAWELHVKSFEKIKNENNVQEAWNELSWRYSNLMNDICKITEFINTWQTFEK